MKRFHVVMVTVVGAIVAATVFMLPVQAASKDMQYCDSSIVSGIWRGVNGVFNTAYGCNSEQADTTQTSNGEYVALGDSVAAGAGLQRNDASDPACSVSDKAYPKLVADKLSMPLRNIACSGATAGDLVSEQHLSGTRRDIEPQLDVAFTNGTPELMTITAGANDFYWQYFANKCYENTCGTTTDKAIVSGLHAALAAKYEYVLQNIAYRSDNNPPRVYVTGYYQPLSAACQQQYSQITAAEAAWLNGQLASLNQTISNAVAKHSFAQFVPVDFSGHELCTKKPWLQGLTDNAPLHPNAAGQRAIANEILKQYKSQ